MHMVHTRTSIIPKLPSSQNNAMPLPKLEGFKGAHRTMVYGIKGVRWTLNDDKSSAAAYIVECCDSQIIVSHKTAKV